MILIMKTRTKVIIAIGSNRNQEENVLKAHEHLSCMFRNCLFGPRMWTEPIGLENSDKFLNQVMLGETICSKKSVLAALRSVEQRCGRRIRGPYRKVDVPLDLDLLLYGDEKLHESEWERDYIQSSITLPSFSDFCTLMMRWLLLPLKKRSSSRNACTKGPSTNTSIWRRSSSCSGFFTRFSKR